MSDAQRHGIWGASRSGKSAFLKSMIEETERLVIFDPMDEYSQGPRALRKVTRCTTVEGVRLAMLEDWQGFRIAYVPRAGREPQCLSALCKLMQRAQGAGQGFKGIGRMTLAVDELNTAFPSHGGPEKCPGFAEFCSRSAHFNVTVLGVSQRIKEVHPRWRDNLSSHTVFRMGDVDTRQLASKLIDVPVREITGLEPLEFIQRGGAGLVPGLMTFERERPVPVLRS